MRVLLTFGGLAVASFAGAIQYAVTDIPLMGDQAYHLNDARTIVGSPASGGFSASLAIWNQGAGTRVLAGPVGASQLGARKITSSGKVSILTDLAMPFVWTENAGYTPYIVPPGANRGSVLDLNDAGQMLGRASFFGTEWYGRWDDPSSFTPLPGTLRSINEAGDIAGFNTSGNFVRRWDLTTYSLTTPGGGYTYAGIINDNRYVLGAGSNRLLLWNSSGTLVVDSILSTYANNPSAASDINNREEVVGAYFTNQGESLAFYWSGSTGTVDLNNWLTGPGSEGLTLTQARDINNNGDIVAVGTRNGVPISVLLTPVPEPAPICILGAGLLGIIRTGRRKGRRPN